jgi:biotin carboxyl carrier protein
LSRPSLELQAKHDDDDGTILSCPGPGRVRWDRRPGEALVPGSAAGVLVRGERNYQLLVPEGVSGQIAEELLGPGWRACPHGAPLARLVPVTSELGAAAAAAGPADAEEGWIVRSPTHGTFYQRPSPDADPYVVAGAELQAGQILGLVEVMKCFSPIAFDPPPPARRGRVAAVLVDDGAEVETDRALLRIELLS